MNRGEFKITKTCFDEGAMTDVLPALFSKVFPIEIEWDYDQVGTYTALSWLFDKLGDGEKVPQYEMIISREASGTITIQARRIP